MKRPSILLLLLFIPFFITAQTASDALRFSTQNAVGTARTMGIGGAINALGADYSVLSSNPAGLAVFRSSEFVITPTYSINNSTGELDDNDAVDESKTRLNFNNLGLVFFHEPQKDGTPWKTFNLGIGYNKLADYNQRITYDGDSNGSIVQSYQEEVNDPNFSGFNDFGNGLAVDVGALFDEVNGIYASDFDNFDDTPIRRFETIDKTGDVNEILIALGANYKNKLMMGAALSLPFLDYSQNRDYNEENPNGIPTFNRLNYTESIGTRGRGRQLKLGAIYRLSQMIRLGVAVHTPVRYNMSDTFSTSILYNYEIEGSAPVLNEEVSPEGTFSYRFYTPWRYMGSAAFLIKRMGFVSAEVEMVNYGGARFDFDLDDNDPADAAAAENVNNEISTTYKSAMNIRLGGEYALKKLRFRLGCGINGSPFADDNSVSTILNAGFGIRLNKFYTDLAYRRSASQEGFIPYFTEIAPQPFVLTTTKYNQLMLTLGFKF